MELPRIKLFSYQSAETYFYRFSLIFYLLLSLPLIPFIVLYLGIQGGDVAPVLGEELNTPITIVLAVIAFGNVYLGMRLYKAELAKVDRENTLRQKLDQFFQASILQYSCLEASTIISVVGLYLTNTLFFVLLFLGMVIILAQVRPDLRRMTKELRLSKEEEEIVYQKKQIP